MWLLFDLDDTLIDTSGSIAPFRLERALDYLLRTSTLNHSPSRLLSELLHIHHAAPSSREALIQFSQKYSFSKSALFKAVDLVYKAPLQEEIPVRTLPRVLALLKRISSHSLCLVSQGDETIQRQKLKKAGIEPQLFYKISVKDPCDKGEMYQEIFLDLPIRQGEVVVIGDRVQTDLFPAKQLGFWTVHMQWGRGALSPGSSCVDFQIQRPWQLLSILKQIQKRVQTWE
ncbi:MAG: HAD family hydrolase [Chlamydiota bacterium]